MERELTTAELMINLYCRGHHGSKESLCPECRELLDYVKQRLAKCPFKEDHGYKPQSMLWKNFRSKLWGIIPSAVRDCLTYQSRCASLSELEFHNKPKCSKCPVHCYKPDMRDKIKTVMRYSGPRMLYRHPILSGRHYLTFLK